MKGAAPEPEGWVEWLVRRSPVLCRAFAYGGAVLVVAPFFYHLARGSQAYLGLFEDDFFYYAIIADKLVDLGRLTYDTVTETNGFHPLWFVVLLVLRLLTGALNTPFYVALSFVFLATMIATYELSRVFARTLGARPELAAAVATIPSIATNRLVSSGMETALGVPLLLWLFIEAARSTEISPRRALRLGAIASLAVLARLDIALAVGLLLIAWLVLARPGLSAAATRLAAFGAGGAAVPLYAAWNWIEFGSIVPVSGLAKQLVDGYGVSIPYLYSIAFMTPYGRLAGITLVLGVLAALVIWLRRSVERPQAFVTAVVALAFAGLFWGLNSLSGWMYFGWYAYPMAPAVVAALTLVGRAVTPYLARAALRSSAAAVVIAAGVLLTSVEGIGYAMTHGPLWTVKDNGLLAMSVELSEHMGDRRGVLGMGAIGGYVAYVLEQPMVQLEGLVGDRKMVEHIRRKDDLGEVIEAYGVEYLVVSLHAAQMEKQDGCYVVTQPHVEWAGERTSKMRGRICTPPIIHFVTRTPGNPWSIFDPLETFVFDVRKGRWRGATARESASLNEAPAR